MTNLPLVVGMLVAKFGGTLVGSAATQYHGVAVEPKDWDVRLEDATAEKIAVLYLEKMGYMKETIDVPSEYMRPGHTMWTGRMCFGKMSIDLFVGGEVIQATNGVASLMDVLRGHMRKDPRGKNKEYINLLIEAIVK